MNRDGFLTLPKGTLIVLQDGHRHRLALSGFLRQRWPTEAGVHGELHVPGIDRSSRPKPMVTVELAEIA